ncbi:MAG: CAP domain-containing protein [Lachnospiraceae bacterium]|nr:CAP domain-containing protein [Candidatus Merdinaster equi]
MIKKLLAAVLLGAMVVSSVACGNVQGELDADAAIREYNPDDTTVYIVDEDTALGGSIVDATMTEAEIQRASELKAMAVEAFVACNDQRKALGLPAYVWSDDLAIAAQVRAKEIVKVFSHTRPDGSDYWTVNGNIVYGENLGRKFNNASAIVNSWMNSAPHKANILDRELRTMGIALYEAADGSIYWAQEFGY